MDNTEELYKKKIGKKIKLARKQSNYTQEKLAEKTTLSTRYISQLERGLAFGSASTIISICNALNIDSDFLFSDLITKNSPDFDYSVDNKFLDIYTKLDKRNKKILSLLANQLYNLQKEESNSNAI